jgi:DNA polymerase-3 subunit beta
MATEDARPELAGVLARTEESMLIFAATDSYRLAEARMSLGSAPPTPVSVIVPARGAQEFRRALEGATEAILRVGDEQLRLTTQLQEVVSRRVEGTYPDYVQIIPKKQPTNVEMERADLLRAIRASAVFSSNAVSRVTLEVGEHVVRVSATTPEMGDTETTLSAEVRGATTAIVFNERFLRDALGAVASDRVQIGLGTAATPAMFRPVGVPGRAPDGVTVLALVMPIKS